MSASIVALGLVTHRAAAEPNLPDIGSVRRSIAAFVAVAMVIVGLAGWSRTDVPAIGSAPQVSASF